MKQALNNFFSNLFDTPKIIDARLQVFTRNAIAAVNNSNPNNVFDAHVGHYKQATIPILAKAKPRA